MIDEITRLRAAEAGLPAAESHPDHPLVCYPLRVDWEAAQVAADLDAQPWPSAAVVAHLVNEGYPLAVKQLATYAMGHGWNLKITHARGSWPSVGQKPSRQRESYAVRMVRGEDRAVAVYVEQITKGWAWDSMFRWVQGTTPAPAATITALKGLL